MADKAVLPVLAEFEKEIIFYNISFSCHLEQGVHFLMLQLNFQVILSMSISFTVFD